MAVRFDWDKGNVARHEGVPADAPPWTFSVWVKRLGDASAMTAFSLGGGTYRALGHGGTSGDGTVFFERADDALGPAGAVIANEWHHVLATQEAGGLATVYVDGVAGTSVNIGVGGASHEIAVGGLNINEPPTPNVLSFYDGDIAEAALWDVIVGSGSRAALAAGANPLAVESSDLVFYAPMIEAEQPLPDLVGGRDLTMEGRTGTEVLPTTAPDHPPVDPVPTPGAALTLDLSDALGLAEDLGTGRGRSVLMSDTLPLAESLGRTRGRTLAFVDALPLADSLDAARGRVLALADALPLADSLRRARARVLRLVDGLPLVDSLIRSLPSVSGTRPWSVRTGATAIARVHVGDRPLGTIHLGASRGSR